MLFLFGTDPEQCRELRDLLPARISETIVIVTTSAGDPIPQPKESETIIISSDERE
jgi:hypothetical protein